jgi:hypothetical protein
MVPCLLAGVPGQVQEGDTVSEAIAHQPERKPMHVILGPCRCQGCGQEVLWVAQGDDSGWLHESGELRCRRNRATGERPYEWRHGYRLVPATVVVRIDWTDRGKRRDEKRRWRAAGAV